MRSARLVFHRNAFTWFGAPLSFRGLPVTAFNTLLQFFSPSFVQNGMNRNGVDRSQPRSCSMQKIDDQRDCP
jgi:hypothetical protein